MKRPVQWTCPKCHHENVTLHNVELSHDTNIEYCDGESGGCDERFVVETKLTIETVAVYTLVREAKA